MFRRKSAGHTLTQVTVRGGSNFRGSGAAGADGPHRLVCHQNTGELFGGQRAGAIVELRFADALGVAGFALGEGFADADDGSESRGEGRLGFFGYRLVGFAEELAAF